MESTIEHSHRRNRGRTDVSRTGHDYSGRPFDLALASRATSLTRPINVTRRDIGVNFVDDEAVITVWAPYAGRVDIQVLGNIIPLALQEHGYWTATSSEVKPGDNYMFLLDGLALPDPASLCQPMGVHGPSQALDLSAFAWTDQQWTNPTLDEYIFYEVHVGTFSKEGTFRGIIDKLAHLKSLGVTAIEVMPVGHFPGERNWGYDGVFPFAVHTAYGGARGLQEFVNACHAHGLAVVLDVVYNHLGPEGNYLPAFGPYFTSKYKTPWGDAINYDDAGCDGVRQFIIENVLLWFRDFHVDALRLDAVHAIKDFSPVHILQDIRQHVDGLIHASWRMHYLIAELDLNDTRYIEPVEKKGYGLDGQWIDEFHHALRVTAGQEQTGYYADFRGIRHLAKAYRDAYVYDGQYSEHRAKYFGVSAGHHGGNKFVVFSQNHDHVGNRMLGERTSALLSFDMLKVMAGATLLSPYLPLLFMGEEYGEKNPFQYFVHHSDKTLIENVRKGRREEFASFHAGGEAPDPQDQKTFERSTLQWNLLQHEHHHALFLFYQALISLRKSHPALRRLDRHTVEVMADEESNVLVLHRWHQGAHVWCLMNFSTTPQPTTLSDAHHLQKVLDSGHDRWKGRGSSPDVLFTGRIILAPESFVVYTSQHD